MPCCSVQDCDHLTTREDGADDYASLLTLAMQWENSADDNLIYYSYFLSLSPRETICMQCQSLFSGKYEKKYFKMSSAKFFTQHAKC